MSNEMKMEQERTINLNGNELVRDEDGQYVEYDAYDDEEDRGSRSHSALSAFALVASIIALGVSIITLVAVHDFRDSVLECRNAYADLVYDNMETQGLLYTMLQIYSEPKADKEIYTVTVQYNFSDGGKAHPSYCEKVKSGGSVEIASPTIKGFRPDQDVVRLDNVTGDYVVVVSYYDVAQPSKDRPDPARSSTELEQNVPHPDTPPSKKNPVSE